MNRLGVVVIGRNEGQRLKRCLASVLRDARPVVYVDSGSTDGSVEHARAVGAQVVELDMTTPFTAARARNAGFEHLLDRHGELELVQFVDGDCEIVESWFDHARAHLEQRPEVAVVCGRLRERYPDETVYNRLCDMEWHTATGEVKASGGIFMIRSRAFRDAGRFDETMIAGEEPELCARLRGRGWKVVRLAEEMAWHDAATTQFAQWWKRTVRAGHAFMEGHTKHGGTRQGYAARQVRSNWVWGLGVPVAVLLSLYPTGGWSLLLLLGYPVMVVRICRHRVLRMGDPVRHALLYGAFIMLGKLPSAVGQVRFQVARLAGRQGRIIEYKTAER